MNDLLKVMINFIKTSDALFCQLCLNDCKEYCGCTQHESSDKSLIKSWRVN